MDITGLSSSALTERLYELRRQERALLVEFLESLAEVARRKVHVESGYPTLFDFLQRFLGYSNASAYRRMTATELYARFPAIGPYLADGRLCLTTLVALRNVLDDETHVQTLERAAGKTEDEVKKIVAALRPQPAPPDLLRRLPQREASPPAPAAAPPAPAAPLPRALPRIEPISEELHTLRVTVGREFVDDLRAVRAALSHTIPDGNLEKILHECLRRTRRELARRREGATVRAPREPLTTKTPAGRGIARAELRAVWRRDQGRCTYVAPDGTRCNSTHQLQMHHIVPFARGGAATAANLTLHCAVHNRHAAELDFGREHMARAVERGQQLSLG